MDGGEGIGMAKMAVAVLLAILGIGAIVTLVYMAYSWFTSGSDKMSDTVTSIDKSSFSQYDDAQVQGSAVLSALKTYRESDLAIFVHNTQCGGYTSPAAPINGCYVYCALPSNVAEADGKCTANLDYKDGRFEFKGFKYTDDTNVSIKKNTNFSPTTSPGSSNTYVKQSATWYANLVYDNTTDEIAGIIFRQMK